MYTTDIVELKKTMIDCNIKTVCELSELSGVNRNTLSLVLNGNIQPSSSVMYKIAYALHLEPEHAGRIFFAKNLT